MKSGGWIGFWLFTAGEGLAYLLLPAFLASPTGFTSVSEIVFAWLPSVLLGTGGLILLFWKRRASPEPLGAAAMFSLVSFALFALAAAQAIGYGIAFPGPAFGFLIADVVVFCGGFSQARKALFRN